MPVTILSVVKCVNTCSDKGLLLPSHAVAVETEARSGCVTCSRSQD